jgi:hypothetical protein
MNNDQLLLSDVCNKEIIRNNGIAEIIWDYYGGHPIRLFEFTADALLTDFEIYEEALTYYKKLEKFANE